MKKFFYVMLIIASPALFTACSSHKSDSLANATINITDEGAKENGLDLQALGELIKKTPNPEALEKALNTAGSINNLDMDSDGKVDFIKVSEDNVNDNAKKLTFTDVVTNGTTYNLAEVTINKGQNSQASMDINGSQQVYNNTSYHSDFSIGEVLLMAYLFSPHRMFYSGYGYGAYPGYYHPYSPVPVNVYNRTVGTYTSHPTGSVAKQTGSGSSSRSLSSPSRSQKSFSTRSSSAPVGSGGFGSHSSNSTHSYSSSSSSRRSFGSSRRR